MECVTIAHKGVSLISDQQIYVNVAIQFVIEDEAISLNSNLALVPFASF